MIQRLPPDVVNRIAAGEVVQRPSAALKELIENSLDAGATQINVTCGDGGLDLLEVADDGAGICVDDLPLLCERHATSKLRSFDDLAAVGTFGFRGEALASMSFVGRVSVVTRLRQAPQQRPPNPSPALEPTHHQASSASAPGATNAAPVSTSHPPQATDQALTLDAIDAGAAAAAGVGTRRYDTSIAYHASFIDGLMQGPADEIAAEPGTTLRVHDMFRNAPLRRAAFGRTTEEYARVCDVVSKYALRFPHVGFTCKKVGVAKLDVNHRRGSTVIQAAKTKFSGPIAANLIPFGEPWPAATTSPVSPSPSSPLDTSSGAGFTSGVSPTPSEALPTGSAALQESSPSKQFRFSGLCSSLNHAGKRGAFVLFVNKRLVGSTAVQKAVDQAYAPHLVTGVKPVVLLSIDVLPHLVDVNVHPTKHEVLLQQEREIVAHIFGAVSKALQQNDGGGRKVAAAASQAQQKTVNERLFGPSQTTPHDNAPPPHQQVARTPSAKQDNIGAASQTSYQRDVTMSLIDEEDAVPAGVSGVESQPPHPSPGGGGLNDVAVSAPRPTAAPASKKGQPIALRPVSEGALSANPASFGNTTSSQAPAWHRTRSDAQRGSMDSFVVRVSKDEALEAQEAQCQDIIDKEVEKYGGFRRKSKREQTGYGHQKTEMEILEVEDSNPGPPPAQSTSVDPRSKEEDNGNRHRARAMPTENNESGPTPSALAKLLGGVGAAAAKGEKDFFAGSASEASSSSAASSASSRSSESQCGDSDDASSADGSVADEDEKLLNDEDGTFDRRDRHTSAAAALPSASSQQPANTSMGGLFAKFDASTGACSASDGDDEDDCAPAAAGRIVKTEAVQKRAPVEQAKQTQHRDVEKQEMLADFRAAMAKQSTAANPAAAVAADDDDNTFARNEKQNDPTRPRLGDFATPNRFSAVSITDARSNERQQRAVSIVNPSQGQASTIPLSELLGLQSPHSSSMHGQGASFDRTPQNQTIDGGSMSERKRTRDLEGDGDCAIADKNSELRASKADGGDGQEEELLESVHAIRGDILAHGHGKLKQMFSSLVLVGPVNARTFLAQSGTTLYLLNTSALAYHACFQSIFAQWSVLPRYVIENPPTLKELLLFSLVNDPGMAGQLRALRTATARPSSTHQHQQQGEEDRHDTATAARPSRRSSNFESMLAQASSTTGKDVVPSRSSSTHLQTAHAPTPSAKTTRSEGAKSANKSKGRPRRSKSKYILDQCSGSDGSTSGGSEDEDETRGGFIVPDGVADDEDAQAAEAEREARRMRRLAREEESKLLLGKQAGEVGSDAGAPSCARAQPCGLAHGESTMRNGGVHIPGHIDAGAAHQAADSAVRTLVQWAPMLEEYFGIVLSVDPAQCPRPCSFTTPNRMPRQNDGHVNANDVDACLNPPGAADPESMGTVMPDSVRLSELPAPLSTAWPLPFRSVPLFLWRLSSCVDFSSEEASFVDVAREIALLVTSQCGAQRHDMASNAPAAPMTTAITSQTVTSHSQNPAFAAERSFKKGYVVSVESGDPAGASEADGSRSGPRFREPYDDLRVPLSKLTEALRAPWFVPPRELATEQAVRTVVTVEALYKVFERC